jgi:hypothetical protein
MNYLVLHIKINIFPLELWAPCLIMCYNISQIPTLFSVVIVKYRLYEKEVKSILGLAVLVRILKCESTNWQHINSFNINTSASFVFLRLQHLKETFQNILSWFISAASNTLVMIFLFSDSELDILVWFNT